MAEEQGTKPSWLAGGRYVGDYAPYQLFAGSKPPVTDHGVVGTEALLQYQVITIAADGTIVPWTGADGSTRPYGVTAVPAQPGDNVPYYTEADFNHLALEWPAAISTLAQRKAAFRDHPNIYIHALPPAAPRP